MGIGSRRSRKVNENSGVRPRTLHTSGKTKTKEKKIHQSRKVNGIWLALTMDPKKKNSDVTTNGVACGVASRQIYVRLTFKKDSGMGWLRLVGSLKLQVSFAEYLLFYRALFVSNIYIKYMLDTKRIQVWGGFD